MDSSGGSFSEREQASDTEFSGDLPKSFEPFESEERSQDVSPGDETESSLAACSREMISNGFDHFIFDYRQSHAKSLPPFLVKIG